MIEKKYQSFLTTLAVVTIKELLNKDVGMHGNRETGGEKIKLPFKDLFYFPSFQEQPYTYLCGHSLGLQPKSTPQILQQELGKWQENAILSYFIGKEPWGKLPQIISKDLAQIVGATENEVVTMNSLTVNLHLMLATFYQPSAKKYKILIEENVFPSDRYAVQSHLTWHGFDAQKDLIVLPSNKATHQIEIDVIEAVLKEQGSSIALAILPGVQYLTGQVFDINNITQLLKKNNIVAGWDLAHAVGNIPLSLHDWDIDFAVWCHYKYLNAGPGAVAGCFINEKHATNKKLFRLQGWWGNEPESRFLMRETFEPFSNAFGWQISCAPILALAPLKASLTLIKQAGGMAELRSASINITEYLVQQLQAHLANKVDIITPSLIEQRGCQVSITLKELDSKTLCEQMLAKGVIADYRHPNVIRLAPVPLYNDKGDIDHLIKVLKTLLDEQNK